MPHSHGITFSVLLGAGLLVSGCQPAHRTNEPVDLNPNFRMVAEGTNRRLSFKPDHPGELYVYDTDSGQPVYRGHLGPGEQFVLEPDADHATIDKEPVSLIHVTTTRDN